MEDELLESYLHYLQSEKGYSPCTVKAYRYDLLEFRDFLAAEGGGVRVAEVDFSLLRRWMASRAARGMKPRTVNRGMCSLRSFFKYLGLTHAVDRNPARYVKSMKADKPLPAFVKEKEMDTLFDKCLPSGAAGDREERDRLVLLVLYHTGLRRAELCSLNVGNIDMQRSELKVTGKRNKQRIVPFCAELREAFEEYLPKHCAEMPPDAPLFRGTRGARISPACVYLLVKQYLSLVTQQKKRSPHVLRHTYATALLNHGADINAVKELLGHESLSTTQIYTHTVFADLKKAYARAHPRGEGK